MDRVNQIDKGNYEGYLWYSDSQEPIILERKTFECQLDNQMNPYIIEGQLYDKGAKVSYSVKYVDGQYIAYRFNNITGDADSKDPHIVIENKSFCTNRMDSRMLIFQQWWRERPDPLCEGMKVLQPAELIFVGFKKEGGI